MQSQDLTIDKRIERRKRLNAFITSSRLTFVLVVVLFREKKVKDRTRLGSSQKGTEAGLNKEVANQSSEVL